MVSKPSEGNMQCSKKSCSNRLQIKEIGKICFNSILFSNLNVYNFKLICIEN